MALPAMNLRQACNPYRPETGRHTKHRQMIQNNTYPTAQVRLQLLKHTSHFCYYFSPIAESPLHLYYAVRVVQKVFLHATPIQ